MLLLTSTVLELLWIAPPVSALLLINVLFSMVAEFPLGYSAPPPNVVEFESNVLSLIVNMVALELATAPPPKNAKLLLN